MGYESWFEASKEYDCPRCIQEYEDECHRGPWGSFMVVARVSPRVRGTYHSPPEPASIEEVTHVDALGEPCRHAEDDLVDEYLVRTFKDDFANGDIPCSYTGHDPL